MISRLGEVWEYRAHSSSKPVSGPCDEMLEGPDHFRFADQPERTRKTGTSKVNWDEGSNRLDCFRVADHPGESLAKRLVAFT
jgi:hypothetical protein